MTELINNRAYRQEKLKEIIRELHQGSSVDAVKERFRTLIKDIGSTEISQLEQALIDEGMPEEEIKRLCDVHVSVFQDALDRQPPPDAVPGHPVHTFRMENAALRKVIETLRSTIDRLALAEGTARDDLLKAWHGLQQQLLEVENHYSRKENILFPYLEKHGITGPPSVMWSTHDDIRYNLKQIGVLLQQKASVSRSDLADKIQSLVLPTLKTIEDMIYKEESILFPMSMETLSEDEWQAVADQSDDIGYTLVAPKTKWEPVRSEALPTAPTELPTEHLQLATGVLKLEEIELILNHLPIDITFVDKDNVVRYFSQGAERIFARTKAIIGRKVENCHPPESVHVVTEIIEDFRMGKRDTADFWINLKGQLVYIRYFAVRDDEGQYVGVVEVTQNITPLQALQGEKRLLDEPFQ
ncbi:MAG: DUF438 domain-containing protein [Firmicutes bacterium]|nr:DUF438 domain-containing protein [Bacillota bacterium]